MMLGMSQEKLGDALGLTFQQVQKYEKGTNRIGASRLQQISQILQVPVSFFFEGAPHVGSNPTASTEAPSPAYVSDFLATSDGLALTKSFMRIKDSKLRRRIVDLVEQIAGDDDLTAPELASHAPSHAQIRPMPAHPAHILTAAAGRCNEHAFSADERLRFVPQGECLPCRARATCLRANPCPKVIRTRSATRFRTPFSMRFSRTTSSSASPTTAW